MREEFWRKKFLYDCTKKMVKVLGSFDQKYNMEGIGAKNFIMDRLLGYKGVDFKIIINYVQEIQVILMRFVSMRWFGKALSAILGPSEMRWILKNFC